MWQERQKRVAKLILFSRDLNTSRRVYISDTYGFDPSNKVPIPIFSLWFSIWLARSHAQISEKSSLERTYKPPSHGVDVNFIKHCVLFSTNRFAIGAIIGHKRDTKLSCELQHAWHSDHSFIHSIICRKSRIAAGRPSLIKLASPLKLADKALCSKITRCTVDSFILRAQ